METESLIDKIKALKRQKQVSIFAHYYQPIEIQKLANYIGDSLGLAKIAREQKDSKYIILAGVHFMAETASILNQNKVILSPNFEAGCPLASFIDPKIINEFKMKYPNSPLIVYVNTTAETKANSDVCCTSSNSLKVIENVAKDWKTDTILFGPDKNLANFVRNRTSLNIITVPEKGNCPIHNFLSIKDIEREKKNHPGASILVHPESPLEVQNEADFIGSTSQMLQYTKDNPNPNGFIVGTEIGLIEHLRWKNPEQSYYPLNKYAICKNMKKINLKNLFETLDACGTPSQSKYEIRVSEESANLAIVPLERMLQYS
ncbi:MAG: quinolinate synthase NadA [Candidatus Lokiarchaeota archaeon]|nr:quinolinate synthase NadA [Candidatus Harpocratesius repetitus]